MTDQKKVEEKKVENRVEIKKTAIIDLTCPIEIDSVLVDKVTMRRAKVKDMRLAQKQSDGGIDYEATLFANLCEIPINAMDEIDADDYEKMQGAYRDFLVSRKKD